MATDRHASAVWQGDLPSGKGEVTLDSSHLGGTLPVSWPSRTEAPNGRTSPEELIAGAHAACFSMALSNVLAKGGNTPERLETSAVATFGEQGEGFGFTRMALSVRGTVPGISEEAFREAAETAKDNCPVSRALAGNVEITVDARLA
jgi:osmotically inducible protein OsmC